jgi:hypothetical protein
MSDTKKARYVGGLDAVTLTVPVSTEGEPPRHITVAHGGELPTTIDGHKVPASFRDSLLEQGDNWAEVKRSDKTTTATAEKEG